LCHVTIDSHRPINLSIPEAALNQLSGLVRPTDLTFESHLDSKNSFRTQTIDRNALWTYGAIKPQPTCAMPVIACDTHRHARTYADLHSSKCTKGDTIRYLTIRGLKPIYSTAGHTPDLIVHVHTYIHTMYVRTRFITTCTYLLP